MTLCVVWRDASTISFASDSRLSFGSAGTSDFGIKVVRIPFNLYGADIGGKKPPVSSGDLGMAFAGSAIGSLMLKEALAEVLFSLQGVTGFHDFGMEAIADLVFRAYKAIWKKLGPVLMENGRTCIVFAGFCVNENRLRAFRIETDANNRHSKREVLKVTTDMEIFGSGEPAAQKLMQSPTPSLHSIIGVVQAVIDDPTVDDVGGNIQYGSFYGKKFQPFGVLQIANGKAHYWRGTLDLNGPDFDQVNGLFPNFPLLDLTRL